MIEIDFIQYNPSQGPRQRDLDRLRAISHAARVTHENRRRSTKRHVIALNRGQSSIDRHDKTDREEEDRYEEVVGEPILVVSAAFQGNSDPFSCVAINITSELNRVLTFARDVVLQAHYTPFAIRTMSYQTASRFEQPTVGRAWADISASLRDEGTALARLTTYSQLLSNCVADPKELRTLVLRMRQRSLYLLRKKLEGHSKLSEAEERGNLKRHIFGLFDAECFCGDTEAALVHGKALQQLTNESNTLDIPLAQRLLYIICHTAASRGQRTLSTVSKWIIQKFDVIFERSLPSQPLGVLKVPYVHTNVTLPELQDVFVGVRYLAEWTLREPQTDDSEAIDSAKEKEAAFLYATVQALVNMSRLNDMYHDLVEAVWMADAGDGERYTQVGLAVALNYMTRKLFGDLTINGVNVRDFSAVHMEQLKSALQLAYTSSSPEDYAFFAPAHLWLLFIGASCEHKGKEKKPLADMWFSPLLMFQARAMGVVSWSQMRALAEQFLYTSALEPDGGLWFVSLMKRLEYSSPQSKLAMLAKFPWFLKHKGGLRRSEEGLF
ncbi:hypothetical protein PV08_08385 [Exophiala spinifera]|uniref:Uncharacterized protein n=1 Tax=Exophiala spinifera TaxID=91928 RepID=A0A0D2B2P0_9EURO|nr:uncharacterized protein PV08_08385 [Exophiala spinifera]KIW13198.1 hypothetical protein PV08_08385 [Exophiala spinifera]